MAAFGITALTFQIASGFLFGWHNEFGYLAVLNYLSHHGEAIYENQSVNGLLERWYGNGRVRFWTDTSPYPPYNPVIYAGTLLTSATLLLFGLISPVLRKCQTTTSDYVLFGLVATMASPIVWIHHYGFFYIGCIYFFAVRLKRRGNIPYSFLAAFLVLANLWTVHGGLPGNISVLFYTYDFFAALAIILWISSLEAQKESV
jgi:hypothetical protein